jgi:hypothetical protein
MLSVQKTGFPRLRLGKAKLPFMVASTIPCLSA